LNVAAIPYLVRELGADAYGVWALVTTVLGYFALLDLGLNVAALKYVAEYHARGEEAQIGRVIGTNLVTFLVLGSFGAVVIFASADLLVTRLLKIPIDLIAISRLAFQISAAGLLINMVVAVFSAVPNALHRFDISNRIGIAVGTLSVLGSIAIVALGYGLTGIVLVNLSISGASVLVYWRVIQRLLPSVQVRLVFDPQLFWQLLRFGSYSLANQIAATIVLQLDRLLIGIWLGTAAVSLYVVPLNLARRIHEFVFRLALVVFPMASELAGTGRISELRQMYVRALNLVTIANTGVVALLLGYAGSIMRIWMGPDFAGDSTLVFALLVVSYYHISLSVVQYFVLNGLGRPRINAISGTFGGVLNIVACLLLIPRWGVNGAALASAISTAIPLPIYLYYVDRRVLDLDPRALWPQIYGRLLFAGLLVVLSSWLALQAHAVNLGSLVILMGLSAILYLILIAALGAISSEEKRFFLNYVRYLKSAASSR